MSPKDQDGAVSSEKMDIKGQPILYDEDNWGRRYQKWAFGICGRFYIIITISYLFLSLLFILDGAQYFDEGATFRDRAVDFPKNTFIVYIVIGVITFIIYALLTRKPVPALYERGIQLPHGKFVPFVFILSIQKVRKGIFFKRDLLVFHPRSVEEMDPDDPLMMWVIPFGLIGDEGEELIQNQILNIRVDDHQTSEPPRLIIYGPKDDSS